LFHLFRIAACGHELESTDDQHGHTDYSDTESEIFVHGLDQLEKRAFIRLDLSRPGDSDVWLTLAIGYLHHDGESIQHRQSKQESKDYFFPHHIPEDDKIIVCPES